MTTPPTLLSFRSRPAFSWDRKMEEQFGFEHASALVFASGLPNQMLTNALNRRKSGRWRLWTWEFERCWEPGNIFLCFPGSWTCSPKLRPTFGTWNKTFAQKGDDERRRNASTIEPSSFTTIFFLCYVSVHRSFTTYFSYLYPSTGNFDIRGKKPCKQTPKHHPNATKTSKQTPQSPLLAETRHNLAVSVLQQDLLKNAVAMVGGSLRFFNWWMFGVENSLDAGPCRQAKKPVF